MSEKENLIENLKRIQQGNAWHGPSLREILNGITLEQATARPIPGLHNIWELVLHIAAWENTFSRRLQGQRMDAPEEGDFPPVKEPSAESWKQAIQFLETAHQSLIRTLSELQDSRLDDIVVGKDYSVRFMLVGITQHHVYHAGQILLLKKLLA